MMRLFFKKIALRFLRDEEGQALTEYILILAVAAAAAGALSRLIVSTLDSGIGHLGAQLERDLKTGRAPPNVWKN